LHRFLVGAALQQLAEFLQRGSDIGGWNVGHRKASLANNNERAA